MSIPMVFLLILVAPLLALAYVVCGTIIAFRTKNPVVRWGFGLTALLTLLALVLAGVMVWWRAHITLSAMAGASAMAGVVGSC